MSEASASEAWKGQAQQRDVDPQKGEALLQG